MDDVRFRAPGCVQLVGPCIFGQTRFLPNEQIVTHTHPWYELALVPDGACCLTVENTTYAVNAGDLCITRPGQEHGMYGITGPWTVLFVCMTSLEPREPAALLQSRTHPVLPKCGALSGVYHHMIAEASARQVGWQARVAMLCSDLVISAARVAHPDECGAAPADNSEVEAARILIECTARADLRVADVAAHVGLSVSALQRQFRKVLGQTVGEHIREVVMHRAAQLLGEQRCSVVQTAELLGYRSRQHFSTAFQQVFGTSPGASRRAGARKPDKSAF